MPCMGQLRSSKVRAGHASLNEFLAHELLPHTFIDPKGILRFKTSTIRFVPK